MGQRRIKDEVAVDLVGAENEVVAFAKLGEVREFVATPDAGEGIVRIAKVEKFGAWRDGAFKCGPVDFPAAREENKGGLRGYARGIFWCAHERGVDRREGEHGIAALGECLGGDVESANEPRQPDDPRAVDLPAIVAGAGVDDGIDGGLHGAGVAEETFVDAGV